MVFILIFWPGRHLLLFVLVEHPWSFLFLFLHCLAATTKEGLSSFGFCLLLEFLKLVGLTASEGT